jgi:hypothetical protein
MLEGGQLAYSLIRFHELEEKRSHVMAACAKNHPESSGGLTLAVSGKNEDAAFLVRHPVVLFKPITL